MQNTRSLIFTSSLFQICLCFLTYSTFLPCIRINPVRKIGQKNDEAAKAIA